MKTFTTVLLCLVSAAAFSQNTITTRRINYHTIGRDSVNLSLNSNYELIEDSCADVVRYGHANLRERKFKGQFKDISTKNKGMVLSQGFYTDDGLKEGLFNCYYPNGNLQSKGMFKHDKFDGHWDIFYENGKPQLDFDASDGVVKINNAWGDNGKKTIENGKGTFKAHIDFVTWQGKLAGGKPDGTWHAYRTADATETSIVTESFKNGEFQKGNSPMGDYTNGSRINLISDLLLPYLRAEAFRISLIACNGTGYRKIVNAQYRNNGLDGFSEAIKTLIGSFIGTVDIKGYDNEFTVEGEISTNGILTKLRSNRAFNQQIADGIIRQLYKLPSLVPATADGKPIKQNFTITFFFNSGFYSFKYQFLNINQNEVK